MLPSRPARKSSGPKGFLRACIGRQPSLQRPTGCQVICQVLLRGSGETRRAQYVPICVSSYRFVHGLPVHTAGQAGDAASWGSRQRWNVSGTVHGWLQARNSLAGPALHCMRSSGGLYCMGLMPTSMKLEACHNETARCSDATVGCCSMG
jgi:hypothetical protein